MEQLEKYAKCDKEEYGEEENIEEIIKRFKVYIEFKGRGLEGLQIARGVKLLGILENKLNEIRKDAEIKQEKQRYKGIERKAEENEKMMEMLMENMKSAQMMNGKMGNNRGESDYEIVKTWDIYKEAKANIEVAVILRAILEQNCSQNEREAEILERAKKVIDDIQKSLEVSKRRLRQNDLNYRYCVSLFENYVIQYEKIKR